MVDNNRDERELEAEAAARIVSEETRKAEAWLAGLNVVPVIVHLRDELERTRVAELARTQRRLHGADEKTLSEAEMLSKRLANKVLHLPLTRMKELASRPDGYLYVEALRLIFAPDAQPLARREEDEGS